MRYHRDKYSNERLAVAEAGLSFIGIGIEPSGAAWGAIVSDGYRCLRSNPAIPSHPVWRSCWSVFAFHIESDSLRDAIDPQPHGFFVDWI